MELQNRNAFAAQLQSHFAPFLFYPPCFDFCPDVSPEPRVLLEGGLFGGQSRVHDSLIVQFGIKGAQIKSG